MRPEPRPAVAGLFLVRPTWAHSFGCKSRHKLITTSEVKRNCMRVTECGKEAWSISCEPMNKNRIRGTAKQGDWAGNQEALVIKARWCKSGGCAMKECDSYVGRPHLMPERATLSNRSEESAEVVVVVDEAPIGRSSKTKGRTKRSV